MLAKKKSRSFLQHSSEAPAIFFVNKVSIGILIHSIAIPPSFMTSHGMSAAGLIVLVKFMTARQLFFEVEEWTKDAHQCTVTHRNTRPAALR